MNVNVSQFRKKLLLWFSKHKRALPWRIHGNPYRIFVVEVMLQQTQIKTVIPYYHRWLKIFPNIQTLARAPLDQVLKLWEGLGYYTRARNLHKAAEIIVKQLSGKIPNDCQLLQSLPGIGRYTAGAIASIAFQKPVALVDGNVARVLSRIFYLRADIRNPKTQKTLYQLAEMLLPHKKPGTFNQALMELGSLVCVPEIPKCSICPVKPLCLAYQRGDQTRLPIRSSGTQVKKIDMAVGVLVKNGRVFVRRRPERGIWGGLWEVPGTICTRNEMPEEALRREFKEAHGIRIAIQRKEKPIQHRLTHREVLIHPFELREIGNGKLNSKKTQAHWLNRKAIGQLSFSVPHKKILNQYFHP